MQYIFKILFYVLGVILVLFLFRIRTERFSFIKMGTSSWTTIDSSGDHVTVHSDSEGPVELVKDMVPLEVSPNSNFELYFSNQPDRVGVNIWEEDKEIEQEISDMQITSPEKEGLVVYEVIGEWEQGTVHYAFSIQVKWLIWQILK